MDVIFHIDEREKWPVVQSNIVNYFEEAANQEILGKTELLVNGAAVLDVVSDSAVKLADLINLGTDIAICANAMRSHGVTADQLQERLRIVPAGVVELVERQHDGFAYINP